jgi:hypothetical protein
VVTPFNSPGSGSHQDYKLRITPHEEPQPTPTPSEPPPTITALPQCSAVPDGFDQKNDLSIQAVLVSICAEDACDEIETERKTCRRRTRKNGFNIEAKLWQPWGSSFTSCKAVMVCSSSRFRSLSILC